MQLVGQFFLFLMKEMKLLKHHHHFRLQFFPNSSNPIAISSLLQQFHSFTSNSPNETIPRSTPSNLTLTQQELTKINLLIPRLCLAEHLTTAIHLTTTALSANPPTKSLSLSILIHSLTSQPDMAKPMSFLTILRHTPQSHHQLTPITTTLIASYVKKKRLKEALKVYQWMLRPGSRCTVGKSVYGVLIDGFCESGLVAVGLRVLKDMVNVGFMPVRGLRNRVYRSLLREARVKEAVELNKALCGCSEDGNGEDVKKVVDFLDYMTENWTE